jgi:hypothetical protein
MPPLAVSIWPWVAAFVLAVLYPLAVYPMLKSRRADYAFRALHAYPAALLVLWLLLELSSTTATAMHPFQRAYTWGWTAAGVILGLILLLIFCVRVIRQLFRRAFTVGLVAALFLGAAVMGEQAHAPERISVTIASLLRSPQDILDGNLDPSSDPQEESWRMKLRRMARREERLNTPRQRVKSTTLCNIIRRPDARLACAHNRRYRITLWHVPAVASRLPSSLSVGRVPLSDRNISFY